MATQKYFLLPDHQLAENLILVFGFYERTKRDKTEFVRKLVWNYRYDYFHKKFSQIPCKIFGTLCFFTDHLKHKTVNKTICRMSSANLLQLCVLGSKSFPTAMINFWGFQNFLMLIYLAKYFWFKKITSDSPNLNFQLPFCKGNVNKTV